MWHLLPLSLLLCRAMRAMRAMRRPSSPPRRDISLPRVSVIVPVHNASPFLHECLAALCLQTYQGPLEVVMFDDASTDGSSDVVERWRDALLAKGISLVLMGGPESASRMPAGAGFARNRAVEASTGDFLCFADADDESLPERITMQLEAARSRPHCIIGSQFYRNPPHATDRYARWANGLSHEQLMHQRFREVTVIQPTWFMHRNTFDAVGGYNEAGRTTPEDLIFFYAHLDLGGTLYRVNQPLVQYRFHPHATSFSLHRDTIFAIRVKAFERAIVKNWSSFTIWNAGKEGKHLYWSLTPENRRKVIAFCDVDPKKIARAFFWDVEARLRVPIVHFTKAILPLALCVKFDLTHGAFEENLASLHLQEGVDYYHFS